MNGDYLLIECENKSQINCYFLIYYIYKSKLLKNDNMCQNNDFPKLFEFVFFWIYHIYLFQIYSRIPTREILNTNQTTMNKSRINGTGSNEIYFQEKEKIYFSLFSILNSLYIIIYDLDIDYNWLYYNA
jgi:hypothetical protein